MRDEQATTWSAKEKKSLWLLIFTILVPLCGSSLTTWLVYNTHFDWSTFAWQDGVVLAVLFSFSMGLALTPTTFIAVLVGVYLGWKGLLVVIPANILAASLGYFLGRLVDAEALLNRLYASQKKFKQVVENFKGSEFSFMIFVRISPILPFAFMNIVCSYLKISFRNFIVAGALGMLPRIILSVYAGSQLRTIYEYWEASEGFDMNQFFALLFVLISVIGIYYIAVRKKASKV